MSTSSKFVLVKNRVESKKAPVMGSGLEKDRPEAKVTRSVVRSLPMTKGRKGKVSQNLELPPQIESTLLVPFRIRFVAGSNATISVSVIDLIGALGGVCTVTNSVFKPWASSVRLKKISAWTAPSNSIDTGASISWNSGVSGLNKDSEKSKDVPLGVTTTGRVDFVPPKKALVSEWMASSVGSTNIFTMIMTEGSLVDVMGQFTLSNQFSSATIAITTGTLGTIYYLPLDGASSHVYFPNHLPTTF